MKKVAASNGVRVPRSDTPFSYAGLWFCSLHDAMNHMDVLVRSRADVCEVMADGSIEIIEVRNVTGGAA
jgi:hypothetical protein